MTDERPEQPIMDALAVVRALAANPQNPMPALDLAGELMAEATDPRQLPLALATLFLQANAALAAISGTDLDESLDMLYESIAEVAADHDDHGPES